MTDQNTRGKMIITDIPIDSVKPHPRNPRTNDPMKIAASLKQHGQYRPIVVRKDTNEILAGNHTWAAAQKLGWKSISAVIIECDDKKATRILLADNRTSDLATYNETKLLDVLYSLDDLLGTGFSEDDVSDLEILVEEMELNPEVTQSNIEIRESSEHIIRSIIVEYDIPTFEEIVNKSARVRKKFGVESNAELFLALLIRESEK